MIKCTRLVRFDAAHRVIGHEGNCKFLHGHRFTVEATFSAKKLNKLGMVVDFADIKNLLGSWINKNWDHNTILSQDDKELAEFIENYTKQKVFLLNSNPTSENLAIYLFERVCPRLFKILGIKCTNLKLYESINSFVEIS